MDDGTYAAVSIRAGFRDLVEAIIAAGGETFDDVIETKGGVIYVREQANDGDMPSFEKALEESLVPYEKTWDAGYNFNAGCKSVRARRHPDGSLFLVTWARLYENGYLHGAEILRLMDEGAFDVLRARAASAVMGSTGLKPDLKDVAFEPEHEAALARLRAAMDAPHTS